MPGFVFSCKDGNHQQSLDIISKLRTNPTYGHPSVPRCLPKRGKGVFRTTVLVVGIATTIHLCALHMINISVGFIRP